MTNNTGLCKKCKKRKFELNQGIVCQLTNQKPNYADNCLDFENDDSIIEYQGHALKSNEKRSSILLSIIWLVLALEIISVISGGMQYNLLQTISNGEEVTYEAINGNDLRELTIGIIYIIAFIVSGITFIMWFRRAYYNLHQKVENLSYTDGWAAGSWFIPFVNLYRPFQIMQELYVETRKYLTDKDVSAQFNLSTKFVGFWWALWIINGITGQIILSYSRSADTMSDMITVTALGIAGGLIGIILGILTIKVIKDYSRAEGLLIMNDLYK